MKLARLGLIALTLLVIGSFGPSNLKAVADAVATPLSQLQKGADKLAADCVSEAACTAPAAQLKAMVQELIGRADGGLPNERDLSALAFVLGELKSKLGVAASDDGPSTDSQLAQDIQTLNELIGLLLEEAAAKVQDTRQYAENLQ